MFKKIKQNKKAMEIILYLFFGGLTTLVNTILFVGLDQILRFWTSNLKIFQWNIDVKVMCIVFLAWLGAILFAFATNRQWVFQDKGAVWPQFQKFVSSRIATLIIWELAFFQGLIWVLEGGFHIDQNQVLFSLGGLDITYLYLLKVFVSVFVVASNFVLSKLFIFKNSSVNQFMPGILLPEAAKPFSQNLTLSRMESLMEALGNPQDQIKTIHVAGTNGKGSVTSMVASILAADNYKVGVYTSPYLERFNERIRILDGQEALIKKVTEETWGEIPDEAVDFYLSQVKTEINQIFTKEKDYPTEFEIITAMAWLYFRDQKCDYIVLETGLGGRYDSTNVIKKPLMQLITAIHYDHTNRLGTSIKEIALEKAGIIKKGVATFFINPYDVGLSMAEANIVTDVFTETCDKLGCPLTVVSSLGCQMKQENIDGQTFTLPYHKQELSCQLLGKHQIQNVTLAVAALKNVVADESITLGIRLTRWPGRLEVVSKHPLVILDGSHNVQGVNVFKATIKLLFNKDFQAHPPRLILGFMEDKDYEGILQTLFSDSSFNFAEIICVTPDNSRALSGEKLENSIKKLYKETELFYNSAWARYNVDQESSLLRVVEHPLQACKEAWDKSCLDQCPILCIGSLYLVGQVRRFFWEVKDDASIDLD